MFYDVHSHILNNDDVPPHFLGLHISTSDRFLNWVASKLSWLIPGSNDRLEKPADFVKCMTRTMEENYLLLANSLPEDHCVCIQTLDLNPVWGDERVNYPKQLEEVLKLKEKYGKHIKVFMHLIPTTEYYDYLISKYLDKNERIIDGIKLYPSLDSELNHKKFRKMFDICEWRQVPITCHCGEGGITAPTFLNWGNKQKAHPENWENVLKTYPKLRLNLAHFGSLNPEWEAKIIELVKTYSDVYVDTSMSCGSDERMNSYKKWLDKEPLFRDKLLFGLDFYMVFLDDRSIESCIERTRRIFGEEIFNQITDLNPRCFLGC